MISIYCWFFAVLGTSGTLLVHANDSNKLQNVKAVIAIADKVLDFYDHTTECVGELMCIIAAKPESKRNQMLSNPLGVVTKIATDNGQDRYSSLYAEARKLLADYPNMEHVLNAAKNGHSVKDSDVCESMYSKCPYEPKELLDTVNDLGDITTLLSKNVFGKVIADAIDFNNTQVGTPETNNRQKRSCDHKALDDSCTALGTTCGVVTAGCAICTFFTFGACIALCGEATVGTCGAAVAGCHVAKAVCG
ncbi:mytilin-1-like [Mytilus californianus]|uniref:mytilin-1-like n=1 Tax=Mytilus californianus TaxID=6549 RepID=UPI00224620C3|nr:mytilin-1-like [Mytilus californianus]XP_052073517.1 mytilin-1-like [Mytilus californianus]